MATVIISHLPPAPNGTGSGSPKGTDLYPATDVTDTTEASSGTTKKYTLSSQFNFYLNAFGYTTYTACNVATDLSLTATYSNGLAGVGATLTNSGAQLSLSIDGVTMVVGNRVLVWQQSSSFQNGLYVVSTVGTASTNWVLTRATDFDQSFQIIEGGMTLIDAGDTYAGKVFQETAPGPFTIGSSPITFALASNTNSSFVWTVVTSSTQTMVNNRGYITNSGSLVTLALPTTSEVGSTLEIAGQGVGGWLIAQGTGQSIHIGHTQSTPGGAGSVSSTDRYDSLKLVCITANLEWTVVGGPQGILTIV